MMDLVRDVLDKQLVDRHGAKMGRVDGIVVELRHGRPPEVIALETGPITMARRIGERAAAWVTRLMIRIGGPQNGEPYRIPWNRVRRIEIDISVDADVADTPLGRRQNWLREHIVGRIPGARR
jgi:sporulation protein YlmC with PRC-barrel domain